MPVEVKNSWSKLTNLKVFGSFKARTGPTAGLASPKPAILKILLTFGGSE